MNTQTKTDRKKNQRQKTGHRQAVAKKQGGAHIYLGSHDQEHPETRLTR
jgi:hypothetical protein